MPGSINPSALSRKIFYLVVLIINVTYLTTTLDILKATRQPPYAPRLSDL